MVEPADSAYMLQAVRLARRGLGRTSPNPPVGAVVVSRGRVVGKGYHMRAGAAHAEVVALRDAGAKARGATLYVTLEPCNHTGRTPPCTEAVLEAGVRRVVIGVRDPNPEVSGGGCARLRRRRVEVEVGVEAERCGELLAAFAKRITTGLPLVTLKLAATLDGRIATRTGDSRWITGDRARRRVHRWRDEMDAIMVGAGTVRHDDPELTCRLPHGRDPLRVIVDGRLRSPLSARVLTKDLASGTLIATVKQNSRKIDTLRRRGVEIAVLPGDRGELSLKRLMRLLGKRGVSSVLLEGGGQLAARAIAEGVVDRIACFLAPKLIGGDGRSMLDTLGVERLPDAVRLSGIRYSKVGEDLLVEAAVGGCDGN